ncbi:hypothetical protein RFI_14210 [Reticulomyxa filosa]|uniref:Exocyst complex component Sec3 C-terminal domain-containing protein n=1 Tax=Reticulomyxa filosa TaxID=46433 RepID=X6N9L1_RETFI|nr:hypothetical protein RFI_14210 [Reticulomyxa filosa]|eukprot:ETO22975.1 hypothetical protein RFI_14210 [Reticulomyxa filosa]
MNFNHSLKSSFFFFFFCEKKKSKSFAFSKRKETFFFFFFNTESGYKKKKYIYIANQMDNFNTLHMLIITDSAVHVFRHQSEFVASFLTNLQRQLAISWGQFVGRECKWITESTTTVKQAGVLPPIGKFPAFCNEMFKIKKTAEEQAVEITGEIRMVENDGKPEEIASGVVDRVVTINLGIQDAAEKKVAMTHSSLASTRPSLPPSIKWSLLFSRGWRKKLLLIPNIEMFA